MLFRKISRRIKRTKNQSDSVVGETISDLNKKLKIEGMTSKKIFCNRNLPSFFKNVPQSFGDIFHLSEGEIDQ